MYVYYWGQYAESAHSSHLPPPGPCHSRGKLDFSTSFTHSLPHSFPVSIFPFPFTFFHSLSKILAPCPLPYKILSSNSSTQIAAMAANSPLTFILVNSSDGMEMAPNAFELDEEGEIARPEMLPSDWIELILLALLLLFGLPLNAIALSKQLGGSSALFNPRKGARISRQEVTRTNFLWLKLHLTVVDLLVILCYCPSHIAWLIGYTWSAGEFLCKAMQYSWDFCFHLMSFGVVSIALDRLRTVYGLMRMEKTGKMTAGASRQIRFVKSLIFLLFQRLILICYLGAALVSIPQFFVWTTIDLRNWSQCTTRWHKQRAIEYLKGREFTESFAGERIYTLVHLLTVFWLPFLIILSAYIYIVLFLCFYSLRPCTAHPSTSSSTIARSTDQQQIPTNQPNNCQIPPIPSNDNHQIHCPLLNGEKGGSVLVPKNVAPSENSICWPSTTVASTSPLSPSSSAHTNASLLGGQLPPLNNNKKYNVPAWRLEMRSRIFQTTIHVIAAYLVCWLPYNVLALATFFSRDLQITISVHLELLRICVLLNTLLNPFIYGFKKGQP